MAEINRESQEFAEIMAQVNLEMRRYGDLTKETADKKKDAEFRAATGLHNITEATEKGASAVVNLGKAMGQAASSMYQGKKGAAAFNDSVDSLTTAAQAAAAGLMLLAGPLGLMAAAVLGGIAALGKYTKAANEMGDKLYEGYQGLAESGAAASDGMTGLFEDAKKLGLSMGELGKYTELIGANSKDLALLSSSVFEGRKKFADMGKAMEPFKESLMNAGLSQDQINAGSMQYLRLQTRIGQSQNKTTAELAEGARKYLIEQDALTKLTGATRKDNEAALEEARSQQRFRAKLDAMRSSGDAGQIAAADELEKTYVLLRSQSKQAAQGFGDLTTGMMNTEAAQKLSMSTNNEAMQVASKMVDGQLKAVAGTQQIASAAGRVTKDFNMLYQTGVGEDFLLPIKEGADLGLLAQKDLNKAYQQIRDDQKTQGQEGGEAADKLVGAQTKLRIAQQKGNEATERFVFAGVVPATKAMTVLAKTTTAGVDSLNKLFGITKKEAPAAAPPGPTVEKAKQELEASTEKAKLAAERATAAEKDANMSREEKDRIKKEARESEAAVMQDVFKQREAQLREQNARQAARRAENAAPAAGAPGSAAPKPAAPVSVAPAAAPAAAAPKPAAPAAPAASSAAAPAAMGSAKQKPTGGKDSGAEKTAAAASISSTGQIVTAANSELEKYTKIAGSNTGLSALAENITKFESGKAGYNAYNRGTIGNKMIGSDKPIDFSKMTIAEYLKHGKLKSGDPDKIFAVGKYQIIPGTMEGLVKKLKLDPEKTYLDQVTQDLLFNEGIIKQSRPNVAAYLKGQSNDRDLAILDMAKEFASVGVPYPAGKASARGESYYAGIGGNKAHNSPDAVGSALDADRKSLVSAAEGGLFSGPDSGYPATLHGDEAVVPLNNGSGNFVKMFEQMAMMMGQQASSLDELVRIAKNGNDISAKILASSY